MVSVIVPVYPIDETVQKYSYECTIRLADQSEQLIIVQNGGDRMFYTPDVRKSSPIGFARALNIGLALADGDYIAQVAADVWVEPNFVSALKADLDRLKADWICPFHHAYDGEPVENRMWGAAWMMTRECFQKVGYHDERLNYRFSDQDWAIRAKQAGCRLFSTGLTIVRHVEESSTVSKMPEKALWPEEERIMRERWGASTFAEWIGRQ